MADIPYPQLLKGLLAGESLSREQSYTVFTELMEGRLAEAQVAGLLTALAAKGETAEEIAGAAQAMREHVVRIETDCEVIDTCGTGGTGLSTFNISTAVAMVLAGAGLHVAKHGNRTNSRVSGSADVLIELGVNVDAGPECVSRCIREAGVGFCFAVRCHPAMKYAAPVRKQLAVRTIFNVLGPLTNPAGASRQLMGVFNGEWTELLAEVLGMLGAKRAMVVHADDGLDELSITGETLVAEWADGKVSVYRVTPEDFDLPRAAMDSLIINSGEQSAGMIRSVLGCEKSPARDIVLLNAGAALAVGGKVGTIAEGIPLAAESIDSGAAEAALEKLIAISNE